MLRFACLATYFSLTRQPFTLTPNAGGSASAPVESRALLEIQDVDRASVDALKTKLAELEKDDNVSEVWLRIQGLAINCSSIPTGAATFQVTAFYTEE